ncbi:hypothetical protein CHUAL_002547 [Chamberlinius hualienensis]
MDQRKNPSTSKTIRVTQDSENVFMEDTVSSKQDDTNKSDQSIPAAYSRFLFDPRDIQYHSSGVGHRRNPSYESRESTKSVSECSYVSGSPCESPGLHEISLQSLSSASSTPPYSSKYPASTNTNVTADNNNPFHTEKDFVDYLLTLSPASSKNDCYAFVNQPVVAPTPSLKPTSSAANVLQGPPQIGLDHLENLCKLMEQLGDLREHNSKLQKRVQYLEEMRNLNELRSNLKEVLEEATMTSAKILTDNRDSVFTFNLNSGEMTNKSSYGEAKRSASNVVKLRQTSVKQHSKQAKGRSQSMGDDDINYGHPLMRQNTGGHKAKISKWAKVKEALKWERVQVDTKNDPFNNVVDSGNQGLLHVSNAGVTLKPNSSVGKGETNNKSDNEDAPKQKPLQPVKYLQKTDTMREIIFPGQTVDSQDVTLEATNISQSKEFLYESESTSSDDESLDLRDPYNSKRASLGSSIILRDTSPADLGKPTMKKTNTTGASNESMMIEGEQVKMRKGRSLERNVDASKSVSRGSQMEKDSKKMSKGAWGKVKTILQTRKDSLKRKHRKSGCLENTPDIDRCGSELLNAADEIVVVGGSDVTSKRADNDGDPTSSIPFNQSLDHLEETFNGDRAKSAEGKITKLPQLTIVIQPEEAKAKTSTENIENSPTYQSKWSKKMKKVFQGNREDECLMRCQRPQSVPASPSNVTSFRYDDLYFLEEYLQEAKEANDFGRHAEREDQVRSGDHHSRKISVPLSDKDAPLVISVPSEVRRQLEDMQRNVTEDFTKKMQEWERLKSNYAKQSAGFQQQISPRFERKSSSSFSGHKSKKTGKSEKWDPPVNKHGKEKQTVEREYVKVEKQREKELQWLEKQLQKIEREKQRLAKERQKYLEREAQLEKMRETMMKPVSTTGKKEILIKTSAGEFRFEGISENFTRKLHEWETMRGIAPEVSTLTLLGNHDRSSSNLMGSSPGQAGNGSHGDQRQDNYNSLAPPVLTYGGHFNRLSDRNRSHSESSLANMANVQTSTTSLVMCHDNITNSSYVTDNEIDTDSSSINAFSCYKANSEPDISCSPMLTEGGPCAMEVEQMHIEESITCLEIPAVPVEEPVYSYAPMEVTQLIDSSNSSDNEPEVKIMEKPSSQVDTSTKFQSDRTSHTADLNSRLIMRQNAVDKGNYLRQNAVDKDDADGQLKAVPSKMKLTRVRPVQVDTLKLNEKWDTGTQNVAAENPNYLSTQESRPESHQLKKKAGVSKVKEISAEIIQQAKTLEQTLMEKNVTIRQLQWELLQRDMSNKRFWSELEKVTGQVGLSPEEPIVTSIGAKGKSGHQRSWSAVESALAKNAEDTDNTRAMANHSPLELLKITEKPELSPTCLAEKVKELKSELKNLWSSQESNTASFCSEIADKDSWSNNQNEAIENQSSIEISASSNVTSEGNNAEIYNISKPDELSNRVESNPKMETVAIRRVSDTVIPHSIQLHSSSRISKLPMSPKMNRSKSLSQNSTPVVSRKLAQMSPRTATRSLSQTKIPAIKSTNNSPDLQRHVNQTNESLNSNQSPASFSRKLSQQKKLLSRESSLFTLRRQNAEDYGSSSDSDSESSNVCYNLNLDSNRSNKSSFNSGQMKRVSGSLVESPGFSRPDYAIKHSGSSSIDNPRRKVSKDDETEGKINNNSAQNEEKLSAPSTPIVRSRSTRKLKPPTANKLDSQSSVEIQPSTSVAQSSNSQIASPSTTRALLKEKTAPNVRSMIEKFNKKMDEANQIIQSSPNLPRSQLTCGKFERTVFGLVKSTSFNDPQHIEEDKSKHKDSQIRGTSSVIKSASASIIESGTDVQRRSKPPMSPEAVPKKLFNAPPQPVGIASRIPRCLTAICERDNNGKENVKAENVNTGSTQSPLNQRKLGGSDRSLHHNEMGSPKIGSRALEIKKAKENFLTRNSSTSSTGQSDGPTYSGWRSCYQRTVSSASESVEAEYSEATQKPKTITPKFKGILKPSRPEPVEADQTSQSPSIRSEVDESFQQWFNDPKNEEDLEDELIGSRIVKSASAGAVDFAANYGRTSNDSRIISQTSTDSSDKQQKSTCGLFNFKFRRPKLSKHKKTTNTDTESLPTVKTLCRQSLLVDFDTNLGNHPPNSDQQVSNVHQQQKSFATTSSKSCPSSPEARPRPKPNDHKTSSGLLQNKPRNLFKSK